MVIKKKKYIPRELEIEKSLDLLPADLLMMLSFNDKFALK